MRRPSFLEGVVVALVTSVSGGVALAALSVLIPFGLVLKLLTAALGLGYLLYLLRSADARIGKVSMLALWFAVTAAVALLDPPLVVQVIAQLGVVWFARALFLHADVLAALLDLALCAASLVAAAWAAYQTGSLALTLWCLMLVQAAFVAIPSPRRRPDPIRHRPPAGDDDFQRAYRAAESALRRLSSVR